MSLEAQLNQVCRAHNSAYSAKRVSWNDNSRQQGSCFGNNITDARLKGKNGEDFLVVRPDNFNERIGRVAAKDVAVLVGNHDGSALRPVTLADYLSRFGEFANYASVPWATSLACDKDVAVGMRFQAVFLPVDQHSPDGTTEFYPDTYNYQTHSWSDPRNMVVLCTSQGSFVQQDGPGSVPQYLHKKDHLGNWRNHYLEAMRTRHGVAMGQHESEAERQEALAKGKAVSTVIGIQSMGVGFNRLMTVQIPLKQQPPAQPLFECFSEGNDFAAAPESGGGAMHWFSSQPAMNSFAPPSAPMCAMGSAGAPMLRSRASAPTQAKAARVSYGSQAGPMRELALSKFERDSQCAITITVQFYFVVERGKQIVPDDIRRAVDVCEEAYKGCSWDGKLMDKSWQSAFAKQNMTPSDVAQMAPSVMVFPGSGNPAPTPMPVPVPVTPAVVPVPPAPAASLFSPAFSQLSGIPQSFHAQIQHLPLSQEGFNWLHDKFALPKLAGPKFELDTAYHGFRIANDLHTQLYGQPSGVCFYNMACSLSLAVEQQVALFRQHRPMAFQHGGDVSSALAQMSLAPAAVGGVVAPNLPHAQGTVRQIVEKRLQAALTFVETAVGAGYVQFGHMRQDTDLNALRSVHGSRFESVMGVAQAKAGRGW